MARTRAAKRPAQGISEFKFSDDDWAKILETLKKPLASSAAQPADLDVLRTHIEHTVTFWRCLVQEETRRTCDTISYAAKNLKEALTTEAAKLLFPAPSEFIEQLNGMLQWSKELDDEIESVRTRKNDHRNKLLDDLITFWVYLGGEVRTSTDAVTTASGGPLVRFLSATARAAGAHPKLISPHSLREFVRKWRKSLMEDMGAPTIEDALQQMTAWVKSGGS